MFKICLLTDVHSIEIEVLRLGNSGRVYVNAKPSNCRAAGCAIASKKDADGRAQLNG